MDDLREVPVNRRFTVYEPPFLVEGVILLDQIAGRGIQSEGGRITQRWVLDFLCDVDSIGFENAIQVRAYRSDQISVVCDGCHKTQYFWPLNANGELEVEPEHIGCSCKEATDGD